MQVEKLRDVTEHLTTDSQSPGMPPGMPPGIGPGYPPRRRARGVVNATATRLTAFIILTVALFACGTICVLAVWEYVPTDTAWRALVSLGIVSTITAAFVAINEGFGPSIRG